MKDMMLKCKKEINKKNLLLISVVIVFIIGLIFGSLYITVISNNDKTYILKKVNSFFTNSSNIKLDDRFTIFKESLLSNLFYFCLIWLFGISIIGIPLIYIFVFFKSFLTGFSISSIFACYKIKGILAILLYIFPNSIVTCYYSIFLSIYSLSLSINLIRHAFNKKSLNFNSFMGKYFFLLLISILLSVICAFIEAFISPYIISLFTKVLK